MLRRSISWVASAAILISGTPAPLYAQPVLPPQETPPPAPGQGYSMEQIESILAPVALYPDALLTQVLMASAFPLQVVEAYRWVQQGNNRNVQGDALVQSLAPRNWDPSVKSLVPFPAVLAQMNGSLDWLQQLGYAVANQQEEVLDGIQRLRQRAYAAGNLRTNEQCVVRQEDNYIYIDPPRTGVVYVPYYNPQVVYGTWTYAAYPPVYFQPQPYWGVSPVVGAALVFGAGIAVGAALWGWGAPRWRERNIYVDYNRYNYINVNRPHWRGDNVWRPQNAPTFVHGGGQHYYRGNPPGPAGGPGRGPGWGGPGNPPGPVGGPGRGPGYGGPGNPPGPVGGPGRGPGYGGPGNPPGPGGGPGRGPGYGEPGGPPGRDRGAPGTPGNTGVVPRAQGGQPPGQYRRGDDPSMRAYQGGGGGAVPDGGSHGGGAPQYRQPGGGSPYGGQPGGGQNYRGQGGGGGGGGQQYGGPGGGGPGGGGRGSGGGGPGGGGPGGGGQHYGGPGGGGPGGGGGQNFRSQQGGGGGGQQHQGGGGQQQNRNNNRDRNNNN